MSDTEHFGQIQPALRHWLPQQRWFGGKGRDIADVRSHSAHLLHDGEPQLWLQLVDVHYASGESETYFVPVTVRSEFTESLSYSVIGEMTRDESAAWVHDALHDRDTTTLWAQWLTTGASVGPLSFVAEPGAEFPTGQPGDALTVEQSNTSLVYGESAIVKFFRRLEAGRNPDVEIHEALLARENPHVAALLGHASVVLAGGESATVAMAQAFLPAASDGWALATASVRDLYAEGDLHPDEVGGDFAAEAHRLGAATASVHADLAAALPVPQPEPEWLARTVRTMHERLDDAAEQVPELRIQAAKLHAIYDDYAASPGPIRLQRVHGDLHLGQVLRTITGWTILDFEGEPARPMVQRRDGNPVVRDVASMLRSFDYAAWSLLLDGQEDAQLAYRAVEWADRNRAAFCAGYAEQAGTDPSANSVALLAWEADKAVYETMYETRNRPSWRSIPLRSLERIATER